MYSSANSRASCLTSLARSGTMLSSNNSITPLRPPPTKRSWNNEELRESLRTVDRVRAVPVAVRTAPVVGTAGVRVALGVDGVGVGDLDFGVAVPRGVAVRL